MAGIKQMMHDIQVNNWKDRFYSLSKVRSMVNIINTGNLNSVTEKNNKKKP